MDFGNKCWFLVMFLLFDLIIFLFMYGFGDWKKLMQVFFRNISECDFFPVLIRQNRFYWVINWYIYETFILLVYWKWPNKIYDYSTLKHFDGQSFYIPKGIANQIKQPKENFFLPFYDINYNNKPCQIFLR